MNTSLIYNTTPPYVVVASATGSGAASTIISLTGLTTSNIQLIAVAVGSAGGSTVVDSKSNIYLGLTPAGSIPVKIYYVLQPIVGITMSFTITSANVGAAVFVVQGPNPPVPAFDAQNQNGVSVGPFSVTNTGTITPPFNGDFLLAAASTGSGTTGGGATLSGWTRLESPFRAGIAQGVVCYYRSEGYGNSQRYSSPISVTFSAGSGIVNYYGAIIGAWSN
jgi:hypothetical protein